MGREHQQKIKEKKGLKMKKIFPIFASIATLIIALSVAYYFVIFLPKKEKAEKTDQILSSEPTRRPSLDEGAVRSRCMNEVREFLEKNKDLRMTDTNIFLVNTVYRGCLANSGMAPEDLFSNTKQSQSDYSQGQETTETENESLIDKWDREKKEECQEKTNKYNICMNEYNAKMAEYNTCLTESNDPDSWRHGMLCFKPSKYCYKPICAY